ncbi:MAG TPA: 2-amino-4-hydroxy-6-hydroxymethyldihydropteridine diphosphokinase [Nodularia sp. (in: cyanobacteria)]|nr:2-amino-4-hydroxy-6-hydroxymethyldihydropteridine diphosphokinase [Nodularia sp. (in: cyanobacteria)]
MLSSSFVDLDQSPRSYRAAIGLGGNLGEAIAALAGALDYLAKTPGIELAKQSSWYQSKPVGGPPQPDYINGCALLNVHLSPHELLAVLLGIEQEFGRVRMVRWGARTLDLDLIFYEDLVLDTPDLLLPHPRMQERAFVLMPLAEIAPDWQDPRTGRSVLELLAAVDHSIVWKISPS